MNDRGPLERNLNPGRYTHPDHMKCPKCGKWGKGPLIRETANGVETWVQHRLPKEPPKETTGRHGAIEITAKRSIYCVIATAGGK